MRGALQSRVDARRSNGIRECFIGVEKDKRDAEPRLHEGTAAQHEPMQTKVTSMKGNLAQAVTKDRAAEINIIVFCNTLKAL